MAMTAQRKTVAEPSPKRTALAQLIKQKAQVGMALELDADAPLWPAHLRLLDGLFDALESFWEDEFINLCLVCPEDQHARVAPAIIATPRLKLSFLDPANIDNELANTLQEEGLATQARNALLALLCAANGEHDSTLVLNLETFPIRPASSIDLLRTCEALVQTPPAATTPRGATAANWRPFGLFSRELACEAMPQIVTGAHEMSKSGGARRASLAFMKTMADAAANSELGFWHADASSAAIGIPLVGELDAAEYTRTRGGGWSPQPWKTDHQPRFLRIVGGSRVDPEAIVAHVYATFHR